MDASNNSDLRRRCLDCAGIFGEGGRGLAESKVKDRPTEERQALGPALSTPAPARDAVTPGSLGCPLTPTPAPSLTILFGPGEDLLTSDAVPGAGESQHLDAVVGVLLQAVQLQGRLRRGDVFNLAQLWRTREHDLVTSGGLTGRAVQPWGSPSSRHPLKSL